MKLSSRSCTVFITSPLESQYVEQIRSVAPGRVDVLYDPDLLPPTRYVADHTGPPEFKHSPEQRARWKKFLGRADVLWDFPKPLAGEPWILEQAPKLKWVQTTSAGVGPLVKRLGLSDSDVIVTTASGVHAKPLAEFVSMALLMCVKGLTRLQQDQQRHHWERFCADELDGKTLAVIGPGRIGRQVARMGRAFGMRVTAMGRTANDSRAVELGLDALYARDDLDRMLSEADAVVLSCPHTPETENMIDEKAFDSMKDGVMFINIARGQVVDEPALIRACQSGKIGFAALDVLR